MSDDPPRSCLRLDSVAAPGRAIGLRAGDLLLHLDGQPFDGEIKTLQARFRDGAEHALCLWRAGETWQVLSGTPALGRWRSAPLPEGAPGAPLPEGLRNWEVMVDAAGRYDVQPCRASWAALLVPLHLIQMRLWGALALWAALSALCLPLGWIAGAGVQALVWLYFWRAAPSLVRADRAARGYRLWRIVAARGEGALHRQMASLAPALRFVHARPAPAPAPGPQAG
jgi:hypothetical protein